MIRSPLMTVMVDAVMKAAKGLRRDFGEVENLQVSRKGPGDFVSAADHKAEKIIRESLEKARPDFGFVMEESGIVEGKDPSHRWHIDPLDGTTNFLHGIPHWCDLGRARARGRDRRGRHLRPRQGRAVHRRARQGRVHEQPAHARLRPQRPAGRACSRTGIPGIGRRDHPGFLRQLALGDAETSPACAASGAAALDLAYVAAGRYDAYWEQGLNSWDMCGRRADGARGRRLRLRRLRQGRRARTPTPSWPATRRCTRPC